MSVSVLRYDEQAESQRTRIADYVELTKHEFQSWLW